MFTICISTIYLIVIYLCLVISFYRRKRDHNYLFLYFLFVAVIETWTYFVSKGINQIYSAASFFYIGYFTYYYAKQITHQKKLIYILGILAAISSLVFIIFSEYSFSIALGVTIALFYISLALFWLFDQIRTVQKVFIIQKQAFWVSSALLFWSIIFLFRITLMYWLEANDYEFLITIDKIFKLAVILTYAFFLIGITRKN